MKNIAWHVGQNIYPEHFESLELNIKNYSFDFFKKLNLESIGIIDITLDEDLFAKNIFKLEKFECVSLDKKYININKNAKINYLEMNNNYDFSKNKYYIGISFLDELIESENIDKYNDVIKYKVYNLHLDISCENKFDICLGCIDKNFNDNINGSFIFKEKCKYPSLNISNNLIRKNIYKEIYNLIYYFKSDIENNVNDSNLKLLYSDVLLLEYYLINNNLHPSQLFDKLYEIYIKSYVFFDTSNKMHLNITKNIIKYDHYDQETSFCNLIEKLYATNNNTDIGNYYKIIFEQDGSLFYINKFDIDKFINKKIYLKINISKFSVKTKDMLNKIKISSLSRLDHINMHFLKGLNLKLDKDNIELDLSSHQEELKFIKTDKTLGFYTDLDIDNTYLYYEE
tara:strand:+ start:17774 stop:18967 length:1194 start_codon:yes stop_codon:yes gene_type:complete